MANYLRNNFLPALADDYSYAFILDGDNRGNLLDGIDGSRLQTIELPLDVVKSQWLHYFTWGGRSIAHTFVQMFIWDDDYLFSIANTFVLASLFFLLFKLGTGLTLREMNKSYLIFILAGIYFCTPQPLIITIWLT